MFCPVMSGPVHSKFHDYADVYSDCKGKDCQWWVNDNCIIFDITNSLKELATEVQRLRQSSSPETPQPEEEKEPEHDLSIPQSIEPSE